MSFADISFLVWQWLLLIPVVWIYLVWKFQNNHVETAIKNNTSSIVDLDLSNQNVFYHPLVNKLLEAVEPDKKQSRLFLKQAGFWFYALILSLLIMAVAQPVLLGKRLPDPPPERDLIFIVDTSVSMQLKDYQQQVVAVKRIDVLRNLLYEFTQKMRGERISIIVFAEQSYVLVPLTNDQTLIQQMLSKITTTLAGRYTAVGDALMMALNEAKKQKDRHQTFILFTDADASHGQVTPQGATEIIAENGIPVFTVAVGSSAVENSEAIKGGLYQGVDLAILKAISKGTGGGSYQVNDAKSMQQALQDILKQRQNMAIPKPIYEHQALYFYALLMALLLLIGFQVVQILLHRIAKNRGGVL